MLTLPHTYRIALGIKPVFVMLQNYRLLSLNFMDFQFVATCPPVPEVACECIWVSTDWPQVQSTEQKSVWQNGSTPIKGGGGLVEVWSWSSIVYACYMV
jgi:hypothetical protein